MVVYGSLNLSDEGSQFSTVVFEKPKLIGEEDLTIKAGNRLYVQALERQRRHEEKRGQTSFTHQVKHGPIKRRTVKDGRRRGASNDRRHDNELHEINDVTVKAGNRLYSNALRRIQEREEKRSEAASSTKQLDKLIARAQNESDSSVMAGNRLYSQAIDQLKRQESKRKEAMKPSSRKLELMTQTEIGKKVQTVWTEDIPNRYDHLYHLSAEKQTIGKQRRISIEEAQARRHMKPVTKILPASKAGDMYTRSMERLVSQRLRLEERYGKLYDYY